LRNFVKHGKKSAQSITRARILLLADEQRSDEEITRLLEPIPIGQLVYT
jgi:hypothetical protein